MRGSHFVTPISMIGKTYGRLTVLEVTHQCHSRTDRPSRIQCRCSCGVVGEFAASDVRRGHVKSCGCRKLEIIRERSVIHGASKTPLFRTWCNMRARCKYESFSEFARYGGRGIRVCDEWQVFESFRDWALSHGYREGLSIDRIDVNGNYESSNCRWLTVSRNASLRMKERHRDGDPTVDRNAAKPRSGIGQQKE